MRRKYVVVAAALFFAAYIHREAFAWAVLALGCLLVGGSLAYLAVRLSQRSKESTDDGGAE